MKKDTRFAYDTTKNDQDLPLLHKGKAYLYCCIICISTVYSGYSLTLISASSVPMLIHYYKIQLKLQTILSVLNGILPLGAMLGSLLMPYFSKLTTKRKSHYWLLAGTILECGMSIIPFFELLVLSRFFLGILNAFYVSIASGYLKENFTVGLRKKMGAIYSVGRILGILICYSIGELFDYSSDQKQHIIVFFGPAFLALIQMLLIIYVVPQSYFDLFKLQKYSQLRKSLAILYSQELIQLRINQIKQEIEYRQKQLNKKSYSNVDRLKLICSMHLAILRQFCGVTYIVVYAGQVMRQLKSPLANLTPVIINSIQMLAGVAGIFLITVFQRRFMVISSTILLGLLNFAIGTADFLQNSVILLVLMSAFMIPCGAGLTSVIWSYPSQLVGPSKGKYSSLLSWMGAGLVTLIPPYIVQVVPGNNAFPIFFFFASYLCLASVANFYLLQSSSNKLQLFELTSRRTTLINN